MRCYENLIRDPQLIGSMLDMFDVAFLGMHDEEYPYVVPLSFGYDIQDGKLYIYVHSALTGHKLELLKKNPNVCVSFAKFHNHPKSRYKGRIHDYRSIMAFGKMSLISKPDKRWFPAAHRMLDQYSRGHNEYRPERIAIMDMYVIECDWDNVYGKAEMPIRTIADVPFVDITKATLDTVPYDMSDLLAKKVDDPWNRREKKQKAISQKNARNDIKTNMLLKMDQKMEIGAKNVLIRLFWEKASDYNDEIECDLMAFVLDKKGVLQERWDVVFYNQPVHDSGYWQAGHVLHSGDGKTSGDEKLLMHLSETKPRYGSVIVLFSIYDAVTRKQNLSMLRNVKLVVSDDDTGDELFVVDVPEQEHDKASVFVGEFTRKENKWEFHVSNRADAENNVVLLSTQFGIRRDWRHIKV